MSRPPVVAPGDLLAGESKNWLHGKGTYPNGEGQLQASLCGEIQIQQRMVRVEPAVSRYTGATGDCVVGRVSTVGVGRWRVDLGGHLEAVLLLQNVNLPGGHLRRKTTEDARQMRELFKETDVLSAEVQKVNRDGALSLHTRSTRYGKLQGGVLVTVPAVLVKRLSTHFHTFANGIEALIGVNGQIWLSKARRRRKRGRTEMEADSSDEDDVTKKDLLKAKKEDGAEEEEEQGGWAETEPPSAEDRVNIARLRASLLILAEEFLEIQPLTILDVYEASKMHHLPPPVMLLEEHRANLVKEASERVKGLKKHKHLAAEKAAEQEGADGAEPMAE